MNNNKNKDNNTKLRPEEQKSLDKAFNPEGTKLAKTSTISKNEIDKKEEHTQIACTDSNKHTQLDKEEEKKERDFLLALTHAQERIKDVMLDPNNTRCTNIEICKLADVSEQHFYRIMKDEEFKGWIKEQCHAQVTARLQPVVDAMIETASKEGRDGVQDRKVALEMAGLIQPKGGATVNVNLSIGGLLDEIDGQSSGLPIHDAEYTTLSTEEIIDDEKP